MTEDEIKEVKQDSPPEVGQTSKDKTEITSQKEPETLTKEQAEKLKNDALAAAGRTDKLLAEKQVQIDKVLEELRQQQKDMAEANEKARRESFEREKEANRDNPEMLKAIEARQKLTEAEAKLAKAEQKLADKDAETKPQLEKLARHTKEQNAREVATKHGVSSEALEKFTDGSLEAMEDLAKQLPKVSTEEQVVKPDSYIVSGGSLSDEQFMKDFGSPDSKIPATKENQERADRILGNLKGNII